MGREGACGDGVTEGRYEIMAFNVGTRVKSYTWGLVPIYIIISSNLSHCDITYREIDR